MSLFLFSFGGTFKNVFKNCISGDDGYVVPPVPIPNTVVKHINAESTWLETAWEDRKLPVKKEDCRLTILFLCAPSMGAL